MKSNSPTTFPIRILSEMTGVGSTTLRAWERRYGLLKPQRTPKGHRLYQQSDANRVNKILNWLDDGHSFKVIAARLADNQKPDASSEAVSNESESVWSNYIDGTLQAVADFSVGRIDALYHEASSLYPLDMVTENLILPILEQLGDQWKSKPDSGIAEEHFYSSWLRAKLSARFNHAYTQARGARIICACLPGSFHETGLLLFALAALSRGYQVLYFGANLPLTQIPHIVSQSAARAIILSSQFKLDDVLLTDLDRLTSMINRPVFLGGKGSRTEQLAVETAGGIVIGDDIRIAMHVLESHVPAHPQG